MIYAGIRKTKRGIRLYPAKSVNNSGWLWLCEKEKEEMIENADDVWMFHIAKEIPEKKIVLCTPVRKVKRTRKTVCVGAFALVVEFMETRPMRVLSVSIASVPKEGNQGNIEGWDVVYQRTDTNAHLVHVGNQTFHVRAKSLRALGAA